MSTNAQNESPKRLPDFDRDYYDELKEEYANVEGVTIYSKDDYELDDLETPWMFENRARDLSAIREDMKTRPLEPDELPTPDGPAMRITDLHFDKELDRLKTDFSKCDAVGGRVWEDPMPESDFDSDPDWIHLRKIEPNEIDNISNAHDLQAENGEQEPLKRRQYASEAEEIAALNESLERMQLEDIDPEYEPVSYAENVPTPTEDDFRHWEREAEKRGGNATQNESYFLPPCRDPRFDNLTPSVSEEKRRREALPPPQHRSLVAAHQGVWVGQLSVLSLLSENKFSPSLCGTFPVQSDVVLRSDGCLNWMTVTVDSSEEFLSSVAFSSSKFEDFLVPGRGVSEEGDFVCKPSQNQVDNATAGTNFSISGKFLRAIVDNSRCRPVLEIGMLVKEKGDVVRYRVLLCTHDAVQSNDVDQVASPQISTIIIINECPQSQRSRLQGSKKTSSEFGLKTASMSSLLGSWEGKGFLLLPEYPPISFTEVITSYSVKKKDDIMPDDVTWVDSTISKSPDDTSKRRIRTLGKKKISKRVSAARKHDIARLSRCTLITREKVSGNDMEEMFAWEALPSEEAFSTLYSPRLGHFVKDYCGMVLSENILLTLPLGKPKMWNTTSLIHLASPSRKRIVAGRNETGTLVGVLFITDTLLENETCDSVMSYV